MRGIWRLTAVCVFATASLPLCASHSDSDAPEPVAKYPVLQFGMHGRPTYYSLEQGREFATLDYIDDQHLLLTFSVSRVMPRHETANRHFDRTVHAVVLNAKTGALERQADWVLHDSARYLWPLGKGQFLVRSGDQLLLLDRELQMAPVLTTEAPMRWVQSEPAGNLFLVIVEHERHTAAEHDQILHDALLHNTPPPTEQEEVFGFRISPLRESVFHSQIDHAGEMAATDSYWLHAERSSGNTFEILLSHWSSDGEKLHSHPLGRVSSGCRPALHILRADRVMVNACKEDGTDASIFTVADKGGDDVKGKLLWSSRHGDNGWERFLAEADGQVLAMEKIYLPDKEEEGSRPAHGEVKLVDGVSGKELMKLDLNPVYSPTQDLSVSPSGRQVAVLRNGEVEIYRLPSPDVSIGQKTQTATAMPSPNTAAAKLR